MVYYMCSQYVAQYPFAHVHGAYVEYMTTINMLRSLTRKKSFWKKTQLQSSTQNIEFEGLNFEGFWDIAFFQEGIKHSNLMHILFFHLFTLWGFNLDYKKVNHIHCGLWLLNKESQEKTFIG